MLYLYYILNILRKEINMKHFYKIEDSLEIKLIILYTLNKASKPLTSSELTHIILGSAQINFFDIHKAMDFLAEADEVYSYSEEEKTYYALTDEGKICANHFYNIVPLEVRTYIDDCLKSLITEEKKKKQLTAEPVPIDYDSYIARCSLSDGEVKLLELSLFAGNEDLAKKMCKSFKANAAELYDIILKMLAK